MPISYDIDAERGVILSTATGRFTDEEFLRHKQEILADPRFRAGMRELTDIRGVAALDISADGILAAVAFDRAESGSLADHRLAIVATADHMFGMARMYQQMTDGNTGGVGIFRDEAEALAWLGLTPD